MTFLDLKSKLDDVIGALNDLQQRFATLEAQVRTNDARLKAQEELMAAHQAGAGRRQQEINQLRWENERLRLLQRR